MLGQHGQLLQKEAEAKKQLELALAEYHACREQRLSAGAPDASGGFQGRDNRVKLEFTSGDGQQHTAEIVTDC